MRERSGSTAGVALLAPCRRVSRDGRGLLDRAAQLRLVEQRCQQVDQVGNSYRLRQVAIEASLSGLLTIIFLAVTCRGNDDYVLPPGLLANEPTGSIAIQFRYPKVSC